MLPLKPGYVLCRVIKRDNRSESFATGMSRVSKVQSRCKVFNSGSTYLWQQPLVSNIQTQSRSSKSRTWTRPVSTQSPASDAQTTPSLSISLSPALVDARIGDQGSQQPQPLKRTTSHAVRSSNPSAVDLNPETRRLIHKGRYKLVQVKQQVKQQQTPNQQQKLYSSLQHRKRAFSSNSSTVSQVAKRRNTWVRSTTGSSSAQVPSAVVASTKASTPIFGHSSHTRKSQLIRKLSSTSASSLTRHWSRTLASASRQPPSRPLSNIRRPLLGVRTPGVVKPGKLQRIGGVLYKVGGSCVNRSLQRQTTPQTLRKQPASQVCAALMPSRGIMNTHSQLLLAFAYLCLLMSPGERTHASGSIRQARQSSGTTVIACIAKQISAKSQACCGQGCSRSQASPHSKPSFQQ